MQQRLLNFAAARQNAASLDFVRSLRDRQDSGLVSAPDADDGPSGGVEMPSGVTFEDLVDDFLRTE